MRARLYLQVPEVERVGGQLMPSSSSVLSDNTESEAFDIQTLYQRGKESFDVIPGRADTPEIRDILGSHPGLCHKESHRDVT